MTLQDKRCIDNFCACYTFFHSHTPSMELVDSGTACMACTPSPLTDFNVAIRLRHQESESIPAIRTITNFFHARGVEFSLWLDPVSLRSATQLALLEHNYSLATRFRGVHLDMPALVPPKRHSESTVRRVGSLAEIQAFAHIASLAWNVAEAPLAQFFTDMAPLLLKEDCPKEWYIAWNDGKPVSIVELFCDPVQQVAGVYYMATDPARQHQGESSSMLWQLLHKNRERFAHAVAVAEPSSQKLFAQLGFGLYGEWEEYEGPKKD